ncbi:ATP-binding protein [Pseudoprimorskyibacter insulae]|nr:ATP-binding protein [Pseudoprimorskyibacter insulae]
MTFLSHPAKVTKVMAHISAIAKRHRFGGDLTSNLQIASAEAINNISEHGYRGSELGRIGLSVARTPRHINVYLQDFGRPMPAGLLQNVMLPGFGENGGDLPEGGFGLYLIQTVTSAFQYRRRAASNEWTLSFRRY